MDTTAIKRAYTILRNDPALIYLDSAASSLTPDSVVDAMAEYYNDYNANIARGVYHLSEKATERYEAVREKVRTFINASSTDEVIFTSGTTASLNMIAYGLAHLLRDHDQIAVTAAEHHANFIPWQRLRNATHTIIGITPSGILDLDDLRQKVTPHTKVLALTYVSNVLGTINPIKDIIANARAINPDIIVVVDAAQAIAHIPIDVDDLDCDFLAFSAHKMLGPTGTGVLWGKKKRLEILTPLFTGGEMIAEVTSQKTTFAPLPHRLEAGTPNIAGVIGLGAAIDVLNDIGMETIRTHDLSVMTYTLEQLTKTFAKDLTIFGSHDPAMRSGVVSFVYKNYHPHDIAAILDQEQHICVRAGNHCAMPLHRETLGIGATTRASFYLYNDTSDTDALLKGLQKVDHVLRTS